jgi:hypothetical protein
MVHRLLETLPYYGQVGGVFRDESQDRPQIFISSNSKPARQLP